MENIYNKEILVISLIFYDFEIVKKYIDFIVTIKDRADIVLIENHSDSSFKIKEICLDLLNSKSIIRYYLFDENIYGNAISTFLFNGDIDISKYTYILLTDGDLSCNDPTWLQQQIDIINNNPNIFCCGVDLSQENLPLLTFPDSKTWIPTPTTAEKDFIECPTGVQLLLFKTEVYISTINYLKKENKLFTDVDMLAYCRNILKKRWIKTKNIKAYHHTWDAYADLNHPYTIAKRKLYDNPELTNKYCDYTIYSFDITTNDIKIEKILRTLMKLNVGCLYRHYSSWINIDIDPNIKPKPDLVHDATKPFPYKNGSIDFIYSEHFIEHLTLDGAISFFKDSFRMLKQGGVIRTATFDLDELLKWHLPENPNWKKDAHLDTLGLGYIQTRAESFNIAMRNWGHQYVYNFEEIGRRLKEVGFSNISLCNFNKSSYKELCDMETRAESNLIVEATK